MKTNQRVKSKKKKGEFNYWLGIAVAAAIMLVLGFPILKDIGSSMWASASGFMKVQTQDSSGTSSAKIFKNVEAID